MGEFNFDKNGRERGTLFLLAERNMSCFFFFSFPDLVTTFQVLVASSGDFTLGFCLLQVLAWLWLGNSFYLFLLIVV